MPNFTDPAKAREAGALAKRRGKGQLGPEYRQLRQHQIIEMRLKGMTVQQIADHFGLHFTTIDQDLKAIKRDGLLEKFERKILSRLMPKVVTKLEKLLDKDDDNLEPVKEVMKFFTASQTNKHQRELVAGAEQPEDSFESWVRAWQMKVAAEEAPPANAIEGETIDDRALPAAADGGTAESHEATSETRADASGDGRPFAVVRFSAETIAASVSPRASEVGVAAGRTAETLAAVLDPDRRSGSETAGRV